MSEPETRYSLADVEVMKENALNMGASTEFIADCLNKYGPEVLSTVTEGLRNGFSFAFILESFRLFGPFVLDFFISLMSKNKMQANLMEIANQETLGAAAFSREDINNFVKDENIDLMSSISLKFLLKKFFHILVRNMVLLSSKQLLMQLQKLSMRTNCEISNSCFTVCI